MRVLFSGALLIAILITNRSFSVPLPAEVYEWSRDPGFALLRDNAAEGKEPKFCELVQQRVRCYEGTQERPVPRDLGDAASLVKFEFQGWEDGYTTVCANSTSGKVKCWQFTNGTPVTFPAELERATKLFPYTTDGFCAVHQGKVACAKYVYVDSGRSLKLTDPIPKFILEGGEITQIASGRPNHCALYAEGTTRCWLDPSVQGQSEWPLPKETLPKFKRIACGTSSQNPYACGIASDNRLTCWGGDYQYARDNVKAGYPHTNILKLDHDAATDVTRIAAGEDHFCTISKTGKVRCWHLYAVNLQRTGKIYERAVPKISEPFLQVSAYSRYNMCGLIPGPTVHCWPLPFVD